MPKGRPKKIQPTVIVATDKPTILSLGNSFLKMERWVDFDNRANYTIFLTTGDTYSAKEPDVAIAIAFNNINK